MNDFNHIISHHNSRLRTHIGTYGSTKYAPFSTFHQRTIWCGSDVDEGAIINGNRLTKKAISFSY